MLISHVGLVGLGLGYVWPELAVPIVPCLILYWVELLSPSPHQNHFVGWVLWPNQAGYIQPGNIDGTVICGTLAALSSHCD